MTDDPAAFLAARLDEVAAVASAATPGPWRSKGRNVHVYGDGEKWWQHVPAVAECDYTTDADPDDNAAHIALHDPARTLRWIAAIRALLARIDEADAASDAVDNIQIDPWTARDLRRILAAVWSDHPDYQQEWKL